MRWGFQTPSAQHSSQLFPIRGFYYSSLEYVPFYRMMRSMEILYDSSSWNSDKNVLSYKKIILGFSRHTNNVQAYPSCRRCQVDNWARNDAHILRLLPSLYTGYVWWNGLQVQHGSVGPHPRRHVVPSYPTVFFYPASIWDWLQVKSCNREIIGRNDDESSKNNHKADCAFHPYCRHPSVGGAQFHHLNFMILHAEA